ncbi:ead/Ea22-like family protein [Salmonella enterica]|nr:ead/Ea22-like family protein [Salmonella enterica]EJR1498164.1 ead/Ea22-like family protein [Salmonella enterica]ELS7093511.1 ead/Ea22-like family protein [Salmonella enterica]EMC4738878.1 ead/Ea22-like family protein [Salmonella enterica]
MKDKQALREAAEKVNSGNWSHESFQHLQHLQHLQNRQNRQNRQDFQGADYVAETEVNANAKALSHDELCVIACNFLRIEGFKVAFHDRFRPKTQYGERPDAIGFRGGVSCLIEVKCSRSDLRADMKKRFRVAPEKGMGDWRFYLSEPGIIEVSDLPDGWGLLHVIDGQVRKIHGWKDNAMWLRREKKPFKANKLAECAYMYSALRRLDIRGYFNEIYQELDSGVWERHRELERELELELELESRR